MNSSVNALKEACENLVWDGTDLEYTRIRQLGEKFFGVNDNLAEACLQIDSVFKEIDAEIMAIIADVEKNIESFVEATKINENRFLNAMNDVNEKSSNLLDKLRYNKNN